MEGILGEGKYGLLGKFLKKRKLCVRNLTKKRKQPLIVILKQLISYNISSACGYESSVDPIKLFGS